MNLPVCSLSNTSTERELHVSWEKNPLLEEKEKNLPYELNVILCMHTSLL